MLHWSSESEYGIVMENHKLDYFKHQLERQV